MRRYSKKRSDMTTNSEARRGDVAIDRGELAREGALPGALRLGFAAAAAALALAFGHYFDWPGG